MEQEFKWKAQPDQVPILLQTLGLQTPEQILSMAAVYYDTPDSLLSRQKAGLRIRQENSRSVCCLKISLQTKDGLSQRLEYEVPAREIREGLGKLPSAGAPEALCRQLAESSLFSICRVDFIRQAYLYQRKEFTMELALDKGLLNQKHPFAEWEAEHKSGSFHDFYTFCQQLAKRLHLSPQSLSKLAQAIHAGSRRLD